MEFSLLLLLVLSSELEIGWFGYASVTIAILVQECFWFQIVVVQLPTKQNCKLKIFNFGSRWPERQDARPAAELKGNRRHRNFPKTLCFRELCLLKRGTTYGVMKSNSVLSSQDLNPSFLFERVIVKTFQLCKMQEARLVRTLHFLNSWKWKRPTLQS